MQNHGVPKGTRLNGISLFYNYFVPKGTLLFIFFSILILCLMAHYYCIFFSIIILCLTAHDYCILIHVSACPPTADKSATRASLRLLVSRAFLQLHLCFFQLNFKFFSQGNISKCHDQSVDAVVSSAVRHDPHIKPPSIGS